MGHFLPLSQIVKAGLVAPCLSVCLSVHHITLRGKFFVEYVTHKDLNHYYSNLSLYLNIYWRCAFLWWTMTIFPYIFNMLIWTTILYGWHILSVICNSINIKLCSEMCIPIVDEFDNCLKWMLCVGLFQLYLLSLVNTLCKTPTIVFKLCIVFVRIFKLWADKHMIVTLVQIYYLFCYISIDCTGSFISFNFIV